MINNATINRLSAEFSATGKSIWYAIMADHEDTDHGTGDCSLDAVVDRALRIIDTYPDVYIAVIDSDDDTCLAELELSDLVDDEDILCEYAKEKGIPSYQLDGNFCIYNSKTECIEDQFSHTGSFLFPDDVSDEDEAYAWLDKNSEYFLGKLIIDLR